MAGTSPPDPTTRSDLEEFDARLNALAARIPVRADGHLPRTDDLELRETDETPADTLARLRSLESRLSTLGDPR